MSETSGENLKKAKEYLLSVESLNTKHIPSHIRRRMKFIGSVRTILLKVGLFDIVRQIVRALGYRGGDVRGSQDNTQFNADNAARWFGGSGSGIYFYQSFPLLGIQGIRNTDIRINKYRLNNVLKKDMNVLDIGCNVGFIDMTVADKVSTVTGIEYDQECVKIAGNTARLLGMDNVKFLHADFNEWLKSNTQKYDFVFSFAVHHWLNAEPDSYAENISGLLPQGGYLLFESHETSGLGSGDEAFFNAFEKRGFTQCYGGTVKDDGHLERRWALFRK